MKKLILITGLVIYVLMILIGFAAMAQKPEMPQVHLHIVKNINGTVTIKDSTFKPDPAKRRNMMQRHHEMKGDTTLADKRMHRQNMADRKEGKHTGMRRRGLKNADSVSVVMHITLKGDSLTRHTQRIVYYKPDVAKKWGKISDTVVNINTTIHKGMKGKDIPDMFYRRGMMNDNNGHGVGTGSYGTSAGMKPNQLAINDLNVYPNPSGGQFRLSFTLPDNSAADIKVTDMDGKTVWQQHNNDGKTSFDKNIDLSSKQKGVYILEISQNNKTMLKKLVMN